MNPALKLPDQGRVEPGYGIVTEDTGEEGEYAAQSLWPEGPKAEPRWRCAMGKKTKDSTLNLR